MRAYKNGNFLITQQIRKEKNICKTCLYEGKELLDIDVSFLDDFIFSPETLFNILIAEVNKCVSENKNYRMIYMNEYWRQFIQ